MATTLNNARGKLGKVGAPFPATGVSNSVRDIFIHSLWAVERYVDESILNQCLKGLKRKRAQDLYDLLFF